MSDPTPEQLAAQAEADAKAKAELEQAEAAKAAEAAPPPDWQLPGYTGPLDIPQSQWRLANIKPQDEATKPVRKVATK